MSIHLLVVLFLIVAGMQTTQPTPVDPQLFVTQAEIAYRNQNYSEAIKLYQQVIQAGIEDGGVYFNLGNAYLQVNDRSSALISYLRAARYFPRDEQLRFNIARIRANRPHSVIEEKGFFEGIATSMANSLTRSEMMWGVLACWWWICGLAGYIWFRKQRSAFFRYLLSISILGFSLTLFSVTTRIVLEAAHPLAVIINERVWVRSGPSEDYLTLFPLYEADEVRVIEYKGKWGRVQLPDLREGWIDLTKLQQV